MNYILTIGKKSYSCLFLKDSDWWYWILSTKGYNYRPAFHRCYFNWFYFFTTISLYKCFFASCFQINSTPRRFLCRKNSVIRACGVVWCNFMALEKVEHAIRGVRFCKLIVYLTIVTLCIYYEIHINQSGLYNILLPPNGICITTTTTIFCSYHLQPIS